MKFLFHKIFFLLMLTSCVSRLEKHGYMFDLSDHELLQEGVTTKERLVKNMGLPTIISDLDEEEAWIYYSEEVNHFLFFSPDIHARNLLIVRFDQQDTVKELQKLDLKNEEKNLDFASNYTAVASLKASGFFKSIFSNIGKVSPQ